MHASIRPLPNESAPALTLYVPKWEKLSTSIHFEETCMREHPLYTRKQAAKPRNSAAEVEIDDGIQYHRAASAHAALVFRLSR